MMNARANPLAELHVAPVCLGAGGECRRASSFQLCIAAILLVLAIGSPRTASPWFPEGHRRVTESAVSILPPSLPEFFRHGREAIGQGAMDPDVIQDRGMVQLRAGEYPEHYLDAELLQGRPLPPTRYEFVELVAWLAREPRGEGKPATKGPAGVGMLPYAVTEGVQRLTIAFAEHRRWPEDPHIQAKTLVYAGLLAHYAGDLSQPLHTTVHYNGRTGPDWVSPRTGFHQQVDALFQRVDFDREAAVEGLELETFDDVFASVLEEFWRSHELVDRVYELEPQLEATRDGGPIAEEVVAFTGQRYRVAARFLASLYLTAWQHSATIELPAWLDRQARN
jgi:hypothetical protein